MFDTGVLEVKRGSVRLIHPDAWGLSRQATLAARQYLAAVERALADAGAACVHRDEVGVTCDPERTGSPYRLHFGEDLVTGEVTLTWSHRSACGPGACLLEAAGVRGETLASLVALGASTAARMARSFGGAR